MLFYIFYEWSLRHPFHQKRELDFEFSCKDTRREKTRISGHAKFLKYMIRICHGHESELLIYEIDKAKHNLLKVHKILPFIFKYNIY